MDTKVKYKLYNYSFLLFLSVFCDGVLMQLNGFREISGVKRRAEWKEEMSAGYDIKRCKAKEDMHWTDGSVLSGVQGPAEKELLHRGKTAEMVGGSEQERKVVGKPQNMERIN